MIVRRLSSGTIDYTNHLLSSQKKRGIAAVSTALWRLVSLGQATAESLGHSFYSGIDGQADFMRGPHSRSGQGIAALVSTADNSDHLTFLAKKKGCWDSQQRFWREIRRYSALQAMRPEIIGPVVCCDHRMPCLESCKYTFERDRTWFCTFHFLLHNLDQ